MKWIAATFLTFVLIPTVFPEQQTSLRRSFASLVKSVKVHQDIASTISSSIRLIGGTEAEPHQFPFQVAIHVRNYHGGYNHHCGGAIYDDTHIITAAHCVWGIHPRNLKVIAGEHEIFKDDGSEQYRDISHYKFHPNFDFVSLDNDIAIMTLDWPLDLNEIIQPLKVPTTRIANPSTGRTIGWGDNFGSGDGYSEKLMYVDLNFISREECVESYLGIAEVTPRMVCAGDKDESKGACNGDSGGPLVCKLESEAGESEDYLCGLVSWGMVPCGRPQFPTVFTDINSYFNWLRDLLPPQ